MDLAETLREEILVEREGFAFFAPVMYDKVPSFCNHCKVIGHAIGECKWRLGKKAVVESTDPKSKKPVYQYVPKKVNEDDKADEGNNVAKPQVKETVNGNINEQRETTGNEFNTDIHDDISNAVVQDTFDSSIPTPAGVVNSEDAVSTSRNHQPRVDSETNMPKSLLVSHTENIDHVSVHDTIDTSDDEDETNAPQTNPTTDTSWGARVENEQEGVFELAM